MLEFEAVVETDVLRETIGRAHKPSEAVVRVNINVYGPAIEANNVGSQLATHKLWLQRPDHARRDTIYKNPQVVEFEGVDPTGLETPSEMLNRGRPKPRKEVEHLRQAVAKVYDASKRQQALTQFTVSRRFRTTMLKYVSISPQTPVEEPANSYPGTKWKL
jgi:hypothetical protein